MTPPSVSVPTASLLGAAVLILGACGSPTHGRQMTFPASSASATAAPTIAPPVPGAPPARDPVTGQGLVLQTGDGPPHLCLGPVALSVPPSCDGLPLVGWSWATAQPQDQIVVGGRVVRSGTYAVSGRFDGRALTVTGSVPLGLYDVETEPSPRPSAPPDLDAAQWEAVMRGLDATPGLIELGPEGNTGPVRVTVVYDDGTIQAWADDSFGAGAVVVTSALR